MSPSKNTLLLRCILDIFFQKLLFQKNISSQKNFRKYFFRKTFRRTLPLSHPHCTVSILTVRFLGSQIITPTSPATSTWLHVTIRITGGSPSIAEQAYSVIIRRNVSISSDVMLSGCKNKNKPYNTSVGYLLTFCLFVLMVIYDRKVYRLFL